jgi:hypothetical protein
MWTPLEFERCVASIQILLKKDRTIECRNETNGTHRTWIRVHDRDASFPSKTGCDSFVDLVSVEMRVSRNR